MALDLNAIKTANQSANARWTAGDTSMTKLPNDQSRRLRLGYNPGPGEPSLAERETQAKANLQAYLARAAAPAPAYPRAIDWRNKGGFSYVSSVKDQGNCGSCVAFGTAAAIEATARINRNIPVNGPNAGVLEDVSEAQLFYCGAGQACSVGWYVSAALDYSTQNGLVPASSYRYTAGDQPCRLPNDWQSNITKVSESHTIASYEDMKSVLANHGPLITCFTVYEDFFAYQSGVYHHLSGDAVAGHCVCCIGYDENVQAWLCKNSWGKDWGEGGYFWIAYGECGIDGTMWAVDAFSSIYSRTAVPGSALASMGFGGSSDPRVYYLGAGHHVHELARSNGWQHRDMTTETPGAVPAAAGSALAAIGYGGSSDPRVYYLGADRHVHELAWSNGGHHLDVTAAAHGADALSGSALASMGFGDSSDPRVYYLGADHHVHELAWSNGWHHLDVTAAARGADALAGSALTVMGYGGSSDPRVYYLGAGHHVHELAWSNGWHHLDVTAAARGADALSGSALASMGFGGSRDPRVYYLGAGHHVHELAWFNGWHHRDVTADGGGYPSAAKSTLTAMGYGDSHDPRLYSLTPDNHVQELAWFNGGWHHLDLIGPLGG